MDGVQWNGNGNGGGSMEYEGGGNGRKETAVAVLTKAGRSRQAGKQGTINRPTTK